jgi:hypothetical protein
MSRLVDFRREVWGLERVLFSLQPPQPPYRQKVFAARDRESERAEAALLDAPRNLLISGLFGVGKTIFIEELLRDLQVSYPDDVLTVYECLDSTSSDLLTTILRGLAHALRDEDEEARNIDQILAGVELTSQTSDKGSGGGELGIPIIGKIGGTAENTTTETVARKVVPNAAYQIRELVERAAQRRPTRRLIVAVDDLDKRDPATVRDSLVQARSTLHTDCAFVLTGHPLGVLRNIYSTAGAIFDLQMDLQVLPPDDMRTIMERYLEAGRVKGASQQGFAPFTEATAQAIIARTFGIPRLLNKICFHILDKAGDLRRPVVDAETLRECWRLVGNDLRRMMSEDIARVFEVLHEQTGGFNPSRVPDEMYQRLGVDSLQGLLAKFRAAMDLDFAIGVEVEGQTHFLPQPLLEEPPALPSAQAATDTHNVDVPSGAGSTSQEDPGPEVQ